MLKVEIITGPAPGINVRAAVIRFLTEGTFVWATYADGDHFVALGLKIGSSQLRTQTSSSHLYPCQKELA
jgi:hypothetical protein